MAVAEPNFLGSTLNPNAPDFIPQSYRNIEDFSPEWWCLIQTSPAFRDYWMKERSQSMVEDYHHLPEELVQGIDYQVEEEELDEYDVAELLPEDVLEGDVDSRLSVGTH